MRVVENDGKVRLVLKDWIIFGDNSAYPARLVLAAEKSGNYVKAMEAMMLTPGRLTKDQTDAALKKAGLDPKSLKLLTKPMLLGSTVYSHATWNRAKPSILAARHRLLSARNFMVA